MNADDLQALNLPGLQEYQYIQPEVDIQTSLSSNFVNYVTFVDSQAFGNTLKVPDTACTGRVFTVNWSDSCPPATSLADTSYVPTAGLSPINTPLTTDTLTMNTQYTQSSTTYTMTSLTNDTITTTMYSVQPSQLPTADSTAGTTQSQTTSTIATSTQPTQSQTADSMTMMTVTNLSQTTNTITMSTLVTDYCLNDWNGSITIKEEEYPSLTAHQHQKGHTVPKQV